MGRKARETLDNVIHHTANLGQVIVVPAVSEFGRPCAEDLHRRMQVDGDDVGGKGYNALLEQRRQKLVRF